MSHMASREKTLLNLQLKSPLEVDSPERVASRKAMIDPKDDFTLERIIGQNDLVPLHFLEKGLIVGKSVCRIEISDESGRVLGYGTGFLVAPNLLLTNNHVLSNSDMASLSQAQFNYEKDINFNDRIMQIFKFAPEVFFMTNEELDFTLVAVQEKSNAGTSIHDFGYLPLIKQTGKVLLGEYVSIIQHPEGRYKAVVLRENKITDILDHFIHYSADTCPGSSGSVVCNDGWKVIALHHSGVPDPQHPGQFIANEGVRISSILDYIEQQGPSLTAEQKVLIQKIGHDFGEQKTLNYVSTNNISVNSKLDEDVVAEDFSLEWYEGSTGHDPKFLGDQYVIPHPKLRTDLEQDVAKLRNGTNVLNYTHFSIVMSKSRKLAFYTVVNIDGQQLKDERRDDAWRYDPRIDREFQCGKELYDDNPLDKGHLVRRRDPVWGQDSNEANQDTFHFTNCSPQHKDFNQSSNKWLGLEDYLLEHMRNNARKATVFTGPVFREDDIVYRGVKIPAEFWKVAAVVKDTGEISATAYLVSQKELIRNLESDVPGAFKTFQVKVSLVEALTGLDFGDLRNHDPLERVESTMGYVIERAEDIRI
ncbi:DNA/RNA non-specific endonuclease [Paenibacillus amylolyticus]|uniref:DNA/RNA non-specific endonuclease n=1 Tax=Paenibacillus amylolyticus TaxID=1451 RepID=UPI003D95D667